MTDFGLVVLEGQGELTIGGVSLMTAAWWTLDLSPLWHGPELRGKEPIRYPGVPGGTAVQRRNDWTTYQVLMHVTGAVDQSGTPHSNPVMGLATNIDYLLANVVNVGAVTQHAVLEMPDSSDREAEVQADIVFGELLGSYDKPAVLYVSIEGVDARFVEVGS